MERSIPLLVIAGPTATGKTALAVELAEWAQGEVISADSMQIYKGMDVATAKPTPEQLRRVPHHLIGVVERDRSFSVADYVKWAGETVRAVHARGRLPILVGGTGLYIQALTDNLTFSEHKADAQLRQRLTDDYAQLGGERMLERLRAVDPDYAATLHPNNATRIIRALELYTQTGVRMSEQIQKSRAVASPYRLCMLGLTFRDRRDLYDRINRRVDEMFEHGLLEEARALFAERQETGLKTAAQAIGVKELVPYFEGWATLADCVETIKRETRRYAKRQLTWFRRDTRIQWLELDAETDFKSLVEKSKKKIEKSEILCYT